MNTTKSRTLLAVAAGLAGMRMDAGRDERLIEAYRAVEKGYASRRQEKLVEADMRVRAERLELGGGR